MRNSRFGLVIALPAVVTFCSVVWAQTATAAKGKNEATFDPHNLSGVWYRVSPFQTFSNVDPRQPGLGGGGRASRLTFQEAPFTAAGKAAFDKNKPGYGPRASPPAFGNDPMGTCDPLGVPRIINAELGSAHAFWEIITTKDRIFQFIGYHHDWREIWTDGRSLPRPMTWNPSGTATRWVTGTAALLSLTQSG